MKEPLYTSIISSFVLLMTFYLLLPVLIHFDAGEVLFGQWMFFQILNLFVQPILIGYSIYHLLTVRAGYSYWSLLLLTINILLYLLPIFLIGSFLFGDPIAFPLY